MFALNSTIDDKQASCEVGPPAARKGANGYGDILYVTGNGVTLELSYT